MDKVTPLRLPRRVTVGSMQFSIVQDKAALGAEVDYVRGVITVGTRNAAERPLDVLDSYLHECMEAAMHVLQLEYTGVISQFTSDTNRLFVFNHKELQSLVSTLSPLVFKVLEINRCHTRCIKSKAGAKSPARMGRKRNAQRKLKPNGR